MKKGYRLGPNISGRRRIWTEDLRNKLESLYCVEGYFPDEIARILNKTIPAINNQIKILGLTLTPQAVQIHRMRGVSRGRTKGAI